MKYAIYITLTLALISVGTAFSQRPQRIKIGDSGCTVFSPETPKFDVTYSEDSSTIWTAEVDLDTIYTFGIICVKFKEPFSEDATKEELDGMLESYMDYLQEYFLIEETVGYGYGHTLASNPKATGMIDYWFDEDGYEFAVKGWIDNNYLGVLYIVGDQEYENITKKTFLFDGFTFPY